jgi:hypothetical protein
VLAVLRQKWAEKLVEKGVIKTVTQEPDPPKR